MLSIFEKILTKSRDYISVTKIIALISFDELVKEMVDNDMELARNEALIKEVKTKH